MKNNTQIINEISKINIKNKSPIEIINTLCNRIHHFLGGTLVLVSYLQKEELVFKAGYNLSILKKFSDKISYKDTICSNVINLQKPFFSNQIHKTAPYCNHSLIKTLEIKTYIGVPLFSSSYEILGTLCLLDKKSRVFEDNEIKILSTLAKNISMQLEREVYEDRLISAPEEYINILESLPNGVMVTDSLGNIKYANIKTCEFLNYGFHELCKLNIKNILVKKTNKEISKLLEFDLNKQEQFSNIACLTKQNEKIEMIFTRTSINSDSKQNIIFSLIPEYDRNQKESEKDILNLLEIINNSYDGILIMNENFKINFINHAASKMLGYSFKEIFGKDFEVIVKKEIFNEIKNIKSNVLAKNFWEGELNVNKKSDKNFLIWLTILPIKKNNSIKMIAIFRDITEWKKMEKELKVYAQRVEESFKIMEGEKQKSEAIFKSMAEGMFTVDNNWIIISFNPAAEKIMRIKAEDAIGKPCHKIFHGELCKRDCSLSKSKKSGNIILNVEGRVKDNNNEWIPVIISTAPLKNHTGKIIGGIETFRDVSEIERINLELVKLNNVKTDFLSMVSHELKTPLTIIKGYVELMLHERIGKIEAGQKDVLEMIKNKIDKLNFLINDLLDVSQIEFGKFKINKANFNLTELIYNKKKEFQIIAEKKNINLILIPLNKNIIIFGDKERISQVFSNLLSNAIKFTSTGGSIAIDLKYNSDFALVDITDTGIGLAQDQLDKIFDKFYQVDASNTRKYTGVGLGLSISKDIIEMHSGKISVKSKEGVGSTFSVVLPFVAINPFIELDPR